ncbi:MAG: aminopeptidase [Gemmatimonadetes bacterium]|nr:aminopeptidase [Gemmatimonadota bacterium]
MVKVRWRPRVLAAALVAGAACSPGYVLRAGLEEVEILAGREPIERFIADPGTTDAERHKLRLVLQARDYAERVLGLDAGDSYTTYSRVGRDTLLLVLSAAWPDRFEAYTWWFPIVGRVPYKGFFDFAEAHAAAARLAAQGFDTYVRPSAAFSTLGWFNDPVLDTVLDSDDVSLVSTVIHEIFHNTLFIPGRVSFNESLASFAGDRGAIAFFCTRDGEDAPLCRRARDAWHDTLLFGEWLNGLVSELERLYARADLSRNARIEQRQIVIDAARERFSAVTLPRLRVSHRGFVRGQIDNATLIGTRLYYDRLELFERLYEHYEGNLVAALDTIVAAARANPDDPYGGVTQLRFQGSLLGLVPGRTERRLQFVSRRNQLRKPAPETLCP